MNLHVPTFLPYGRQVIEEDDIAAVAETLRGEFLTTGPAVARFERALAAAVSAREAVACSSGTAALHMAARALGLGHGSVVVVPAVTFLATANAPHLNGAEIVFADVDPRTGLMGAQDLEAAIARAPGGRADAVFNVHLNGQCGALEAIRDVAAAHNMRVIDDACHALGTAYISNSGDVVPIGANTFADATVFSFHPVKTVAMGEGGAVTVNDADLAKRLRRARNHGVVREAEAFVHADDAFDSAGEPNPWYYELAEPGFNWRASDIHCALGASQLGKLGRFVARRRALVAAYDRELAPLAPLVRPIGRVRQSMPAWHLYVVQIDFTAHGMARAALMRALAADGIGTQVHYFPVYRQPYYARRYTTGALPGADAYYERALSLPLSAAMTENDVARVVHALARHLGA